MISEVVKGGGYIVAVGGQSCVKKIEEGVLAKEIKERRVRVEGATPCL